LKSLWNYLSNVWSFIKNGVQTRELCAFYFNVACCPKLISGRVAFCHSGITTCRNLRLSWFLVCWNRSFMGLLNIQKYSVETRKNLWSARVRTYTFLTMGWPPRFWSIRGARGLLTLNQH
jgi:hypothetical protein